MAFRTQQASICLLFLISVCSHFIRDNRATAISIREKCECVEETGSVQWRKIADYRIIQRDPLCNKVQIMIKFNTQRKKVCLQFKKKNGPKKPKRH
ncbi:hypothetical protein cypCar_00017175 [Cyprinus carpio]|nr:hypothetical protein cypCar_00017175 [Cyprinus carpio]